VSWFVDALRHNPELAIFLTLALGFAVGRLKIGSFSLGTVVGTLLAGVLVGLGISSLSMNSGAVRRVGAALAKHSEDFYRQVARAALVSHTPSGARAAVKAMVS